MNVEHLRIAMNLAGIPVNEVTVEIFLGCHDLVKRKRGKGNLKDACTIRKKVEEKYKGTDILHPESLYRQQLDQKDKVIAKQAKEIQSRREQLTDIMQWARLIVNNPDLRPRIWRSIAADIRNRCTD